ncbi:uncharacterized protein LOC143915913 [Arctopsyche grandis]|uniref:uncharacterized protein LOC143915913 n=1 Tax=Arctopsyche grandis TaxID=121162 RepID=UPI00406D69A0
MKSLAVVLMMLSLLSVPVLSTATHRAGTETSPPGESQGSLRGALRALERRRRAPMGTYPLASYQDREDPQELLEYLGSKNEYPTDDSPILLDQNDRPLGKAILLGYLDKPDDYPSEDLESEYKNTAFRERTGQMKGHHQSLNLKKVPSAFRERESKHVYQNEQLQDLFLKNLAEKEKEEAQYESDAEYAELLRKLWEKYMNTHPEEYGGQQQEEFTKRNIRKRQIPGDYSPAGGWGPIAFKKKRSSNQRLDNNDTPDFLYSLKFVSQTDPAAVENLKDDKIMDEEEDPDISKILNGGEPNLGYSAYGVSAPQMDLEDDSKLAMQPLNYSPSDEVFLPDGGEPIDTPIASENLYPVTKRSSNFQVRRFNKRNSKQIRSTVNDPRVAKDLSSIFGTDELLNSQSTIQKTVKRSSNPDDDSHESKSPAIAALSHHHSNESNQSSHESHLDNDNDHNNKYEDHDHPHSRHEHETKPPLLTNSNADFDHSHEGQENKEIDFEDTEQTHIKLEHPIILKKKSIDWSKYFGIDKRKKKSSPFYNFQMNRAKRFMSSFNLPQQKESSTHPENDSVEKRSPKKIDPLKLDSMDNKLKNMEGLILDDALEYSSDNEELDTKEEQEIKEKILSRLAAAYSLEKMRKALKEFKQSLSQKNKQPRPDLSQDKEKRLLADPTPQKHEFKQKLDPEDIKAIEDGYFESEQGAGHFLNGPVEIMSEGYMGGNNEDGSCPILDNIVRRCHSIDILAGDHGQLFLPFCSLHQICYLCGPSSATGCDLMFLSEADGVCEGRSACLRAARTALMALRDLHGPLADHLEGECSRESCLARPLRANKAWLHSTVPHSSARWWNLALMAHMFATQKKLLVTFLDVTTHGLGTCVPESISFQQNMGQALLIHLTMSLPANTINRPDEDDDLVFRNFGMNDNTSGSRNLQRTITEQPQNENFPGPRRHIPVSTIDWQSTDQSQFIPVHGLDFLIGVNTLIIQQTIELSDMSSSIEPENRYILKIPEGETLYMANEHSTPLSRLLCGSKRSFNMSLMDHTRQQALILNRRTAFSFLCLPCIVQEIQVISPPGEYLGSIQQEWTIVVPLFLIRNFSDDVIYVVEGPNKNMCCCTSMEVEFKILSADNMTQHGSIIHGWDIQAMNFNTVITFPPTASDPKVKALIIGAALLIEYVYFVNEKSTTWMHCCC